MRRTPAIGRTRSAICAAALLAAAASGCFAPGPDSSPDPPFIEAGDLDEIRERRTLRVLLPLLDPLLSPPRRGGPIDGARESIAAFARAEGLDVFWIPVHSRGDLIPFLLQGKGDVIAANMTVTPERRERVAFTVPIEFVREQVVVRKGDPTIRKPADLEGRRVAVRRSSSFWQTLQDLRETYPGIVVDEVAERLDTDEIIHRVATRRLDVTVADSNLLDQTLRHRDDLRVAFDLTADRPVAWAVRPGSPELLHRLNRFLSESQLARRPDESRTGDLAKIRERRALRLLTRNSAATYFLWRGKLMGFEYELAREFARKHDLRLDVIVPKHGEDMFKMLVEGRGDLIAAAVSPTEARSEMGIAFSRPYNHASYVVVAPSNATGLQSVEDLAHRTVHVRRNSAQWDVLRNLRDSGVPLTLLAAAEELEIEELIDGVADQRYDLTVTASHILDIELTWRTDVKAAFPLGQPVPLCWAVRASNPQLLAAIDEFIEEEYRGLTYNVLYSKYFEDPRRIRRHIEYRGGDGSLSPYDALVQRYADEYGFDWRLIVALMYQESEFDPAARSFAGAVGLLQVLPRTAADLGLTDLENPETNIRAGLSYLAWVRDRFEDHLPVRDRMWFTLAAYNVGTGHVSDARRIASEEGLDPDKWFDNVERAMLLLSRPEYAERVQHGYCRGAEPVHYVRDIRSRYEAYLDTLPTNVAARD
jgi:membrane-bound lytic murein transglycosylase F